ncbi:MAG: hypothetical protein LBP87_07040, partial [Planctomycetaceae bacterium]|nr:hypothetical protein [Planctomycetaceae bacterium]
MFRFIILLSILLPVFFGGQELVFAQNQEENNTAIFAVTTNEKEKLLEHVEDVLKWFRSLNTADRQRLSVKDFRKKVLPLELMQAADLLKQKNQPEMSRMVREILPHLQPTLLECFEIQERLGNETLDSFQEERELLAANTPDSTTQIKTGANRFLKEALNPAEKMALQREPQTPAEIMKAVDLLAIAGRPVIIRYYLRQLLTANAEPAEYAQIAASLGSRKLLQIANNKDFDPHGSIAVAKIYAEAKKYWQDENVVAESLLNWQPPPYAPNIKHLQDILKGNNVSAIQLIKELGETQDENEIDVILGMILDFSTEGRECLAAALNSDRPALVFNAARGLAGSIHADEIFLLYPALFA